MLDMLLLMKNIMYRQLKNKIGILICCAEKEEKSISWSPQSRRIGIELLTNIKIEHEPIIVPDESRYISN
jgi:hypothetical protein